MTPVVVGPLKPLLAVPLSVFTIRFTRPPEAVFSLVTIRLTRVLSLLFEIRVGSRSLRTPIRLARPLAWLRLALVPTDTLSALSARPTRCPTTSPMLLLAILWCLPILTPPILVPIR